MDDLWFCNEAYTISKDEDGNTNNVMRIISKSPETSTPVSPAKSSLTPAMSSLTPAMSSLTPAKSSLSPAKSSAGQAASAVPESRQNEKPLILRILHKILFFWRK